MTKISRQPHDTHNLPSSPPGPGLSGNTPQVSSQATDKNMGRAGRPNNKKGTAQMTTEELRERFARKANLSDEHHDALVNLTETDGRPVVLYDMGTEHPAYGRSWS